MVAVCPTTCGAISAVRAVAVGEHLRILRESLCVVEGRRRVLFEPSWSKRVKDHGAVRLGHGSAAHHSTCASGLPARREGSARSRSRDDECEREGPVAPRTLRHSPVSPQHPVLPPKPSSKLRRHKSTRRGPLKAREHAVSEPAAIAPWPICLPTMPGSHRESRTDPISTANDLRDG